MTFHRCPGKLRLSPVSLTMWWMFQQTLPHLGFQSIALPNCNFLLLTFCGVLGDIVSHVFLCSMYFRMEEMFHFNVSAMGYSAKKHWMDLVLEQLDEIDPWRQHRRNKHRHPEWQRV